MKRARITTKPRAPGWGVGVGVGVSSILGEIQKWGAGSCTACCETLNKGSPEVAAARKAAKGPGRRSHLVSLYSFPQVSPLSGVPAVLTLQCAWLWSLQDSRNWWGPIQGQLCPAQLGPGERTNKANEHAKPHFYTRLFQAPAGQRHRGLGALPGLPVSHQRGRLGGGAGSVSVL